MPVALPTVFPVLGPCWFPDTWKAPRSGGRQHEGVDSIATSGLAKPTKSTPFNFRMYAVNYNIFRVMSGMGGLAYSN